MAEKVVAPVFWYHGGRLIECGSFYLEKQSPTKAIISHLRHLRGNEEILRLQEGMNLNIVSKDSCLLMNETAVFVQKFGKWVVHKQFV